MEDMLIIESNTDEYICCKRQVVLQNLFFFFHKVFRQAALASTVHEEMDIVKSPLITLMDQVSERGDQAV